MLQLPKRGEKIDKAVWGFSLLAFTALLLFIYGIINVTANSEPYHTQTITEVKEVNAKVNIDMINQTADLNMAVDMILNAKHQLERLEND